jgi:iron complex transport system permease protein
MGGFMKVVLDLTKLREEKKITSAEYDKLLRFAMQETGSLAFNILVSFGVIAVSCASIALVPTAFTTILFGAILAAIGLGPLRFSVKWKLFSQICTLIGSIMLCAGILWLYSGSMGAWMLVTFLLATAGILIRHGLLIVMSVLAFAATLGSGGEYEHAMYTVIITQPLLTVVAFSLLSFITFRASFFLPKNYARLAILASRTGLFMVNMGFWVGTLWGDKLPNKQVIPEMVFIIGWAIALIATAAWAVKVNRRWVLNLCAIFGAIHFYTQWFERLGATPVSVLLAGLIALAFALAIRSVNVWVFGEKI